MKPMITINMKKILLLTSILFSLNVKGQWTTICNTGNGFVDNFENFNGELYATGFFKTVCGTSCNYVSKYNGTNWQAVGNGFPNAGHHLKNIDSALYGVAYQPQIDSNWLYKFDGTNFNKMGEGTYLTTAVSGFSQTNNLYNIIKYNGNIIVCGEFDRVGSKHISGIMQWNGTEWDSLGSGLSGNINGTAPVMYPHDLCIFGNDLIACGNFKLAGVQIVNGVARWDGTQWHSMGNGFNSTVYAVCEFGGELYAGGDFTISGTTQLHSIAKWNGTDWIDPGFSLYYSNTSNYTFIHTLKVLNNKLFVSGGFDRAVAGSDTMNCQAVVAYNGTSIDTLKGGTTGYEIEALAIYNGLLFVGGGPTNSSSYIASYNLPTGINDIVELNTLVTIYPNPTSGQFTISLPTEKAEINITNIFGQNILKLNTTQKTTSFQLENNGLYNISIKTMQGVITKKLMLNQ
jgi:trimeric autotransporter adhesin